MAAEATRRKQILMVDDDSDFLTTIQALFTEMSRGAWEIFAATNHSEALALLHERRMDMVTLDIGMPVMDGLQFLRLLARTHPGQQVVMLTGRAAEEIRKKCLENGAALVLEKPTAAERFVDVFSALDALAGAQAQAGFRGMMQRVGLPEVLQMECLGRKSSVLEVFTEKVRGRIFIHDGSIVHAESNTLQGEVALYNLLALRGGGFNLLVFSEPARRTIQGHWEFLLMEAARLTDEAAQVPGTEAAESGAQSPEPRVQPPAPGIAKAAPDVPAFTAEAEPPVLGRARIEEVALCSGAGEVLYDWGCEALMSRMRLLEQVEQQATQVSKLASVGRFDRLEVIGAEGRVVCQVQPDRRLYVRSTLVNTKPA